MLEKTYNFELIFYNRKAHKILLSNMNNSDINVITDIIKNSTQNILVKLLLHTQKKKAYCHGIDD